MNTNSNNSSISGSKTTPDCFIVSQEQIKFCSWASVSSIKTPRIQLVKYDINYYNDSLYQTLKINRPPNFEGMVNKRKASFLAGRVAARRALNVHNISNNKIPVGKNREPVWPNNTRGSISHSDGLSIACVEQLHAPSSNHIGVDIQTVLDKTEAKALMKTVLTRNDEMFIMAASKTTANEMSKLQLHTLIFSAKESFFKAAYPQLKRYFDFDAVSVRSIDPATQLLTLRTEKVLHPAITSGKEYEVVFSFPEIEKPSVITSTSFVL